LKTGSGRDEDEDEDEDGAIAAEDTGKSGPLVVLVENQSTKYSRFSHQAMVTR
jgi:hypothetical protein